MPGAMHAADVLALGRDDVEVRRRPEVDDDDGRAVALLGGDGVHDPVRPDFARVVVADRDPGLHSRPDHEKRCVRPLAGEFLPLADEDGHGAREADPVDALEIEESGEEHAELIGRARALGGEPPVICELAVAVQAKRRLRVAHIDRKEHRAEVNQSAIRIGSRNPPHEVVRWRGGVRKAESRTDA